MLDSSHRNFVRLAIATTIATYALILVGALVRAAGAGLGCPDWPHCFGEWIPPTRADQLPPGYDPTQFNALLTWTEYLNRLLGVTTGVLIIATTWSAFRNLPKGSPARWATLAALLLVGFQGWLGGQVVRSSLEPWMVTAHMVVALILVSLLLFATHRAAHPLGHAAQPDALSHRVRVATWLAMLVVLVQVGLGTQVRSGIEHARNAMPDLPRAFWLEQVGPIDHIHRQVGAVAAILVVAISWWIQRRLASRSTVVRWSRVSVFLVGAQIAVGLTLAYLDLPAVSQVLHVSLASLLIGSLSLQALSVRESPAT
jgi:cytochrome c oxidase assembly protein subunit 15